MLHYYNSNLDQYTVKSGQGGLVNRHVVLEVYYNISSQVRNKTAQYTGEKIKIRKTRRELRLSSGSNESFVYES